MSFANGSVNYGNDTSLVARSRFVHAGAANRLAYASIRTMKHTQVRAFVREMIVAGQ